MEGRENLKIEWVDLFTTTDCNLNCKYCFHGKTDNYMSLENAIKYMDKIFEISTNEITVNFFGGEPLLNHRVITGVVEYCKSKEKNYKYGVCTNGTIFDRDLFKFFLDNKFSVQVSLDGDADTHDFYRGMHAQTVENCWKMIEMGINISARLTYTPENVKNLSYNVDYIRRIGINKITHQGTMESPWSDKDIEIFKDQTDKLFDLSRKFPELKLNFIDRALKPCSESGLICKAGKQMIAIDPSGNVYPCHRFQSSGKYLLGNIMTSFSRGLFLDINRDSLIKCRTCESKSICHTCIAANKIITGSLTEPVEDFCKIIKYERFKGIQMGKDNIEQKLENIENILLKLSNVVLDLSEVILEKSQETKK